MEGGYYNPHAILAEETVRGAILMRRRRPRAANSARHRRPPPSNLKCNEPHTHINTQLIPCTLRIPIVGVGRTLEPTNLTDNVSRELSCLCSRGPRDARCAWRPQVFFALCTHTPTHKPPKNTKNT